MNTTEKLKQSGISLPLDSDINSTNLEMGTDNKNEKKEDTRNGKIVKSKNAVHEYYKLLLKISVSISGAIAFFIALLLTLLSGGIVDFVFYFFTIFIPVTLLIFICMYLSDKGINVFPTDSYQSRRSSTPRIPKTRIRKYKPTNWKTKNKDKLFY